MNLLQGLRDGFHRFGARRGQLADFLRDYAEPAALFANPGGFDGGVETKQVGLAGNVFDKRYHFINLKN